MWPSTSRKGMTRMKIKNNPRAALMVLLIALAAGLSARADDVRGEPIGGPQTTPAPAAAKPAAIVGVSFTNAAPAPGVSIPASLAAVRPVSAPPKIDGCLSA